MSNILTTEALIQKCKFDHIKPTFNGAEVPFILIGSPDDANLKVGLPCVHMDWNSGDEDTVGTDLKTKHYSGTLTFMIFMPDNLNPFEAKSVLSQIGESTTRKIYEYDDGTITFGKSRTRPPRTVVNALMTVFEVEVTLLLR